jgi:TonB family protein
MPSPAYPAAAKKARAQGVVLVRALVDATGHAIKASVHRTSGFAALDRAACDSVLAALFRPYLHNGVPRSVDVIVPITFGLAGRGGRDKRGREHGDHLQLDVGSQDHHAMRGHAEELGGLSTAALHVGE